jgi:hypothetical protein
MASCGHLDQIRDVQPSRGIPVLLRSWGERAYRGVTDIGGPSM